MSDLEFAKEQLAEMRLTSESVGDDLVVYQTVMQLLSVLDQQHHPSLRTRTRTIELFNDLARRRRLVTNDDPEQWVPLQAGMFRKGDQIRVKLDAFEDERGPIHNGRRGVIVDARRGDVIVDIRDGKSPEIQGFHYRPENLEGLMT